MKQRLFLTFSASLCSLPGCTQTRTAGFTPVNNATESGSASTGLGGESESGSVGESDTGEPKLDLAAQPDTPTVECASITQTTVIEERPSDIILIADDDASRVLIQDQATNLLPGIQSLGVFDANVVLIVSGPAPAADTSPEPSEFDCGEWACRGAAAYRSLFQVVDIPVPAGDILSTIVDSHDQWASAMRPDAWKHVWITTTAAADAGMTNPEFLDQLETALDSDGGVFIHVLGDGGSFVEDPLGYQDLVQTTGGFYAPGLRNFSKFQDAVLERVVGAGLACDYEIPPPPQGQVFDRDKVNVIYDDGEEVRTIGYVETGADCQEFGFGWHYDDPVTPTEILMCPLSCQNFEMLSNATIDIEFGCATVPAG